MAGRMAIVRQRQVGGKIGCCMYDTYIAHPGWSLPGKGESGLHKSGLLFQISNVQYYEWAVVSRSITRYWLDALTGRSLRAARFSLSFARTLSLLIGRLADVWPGKT